MSVASDSTEPKPPDDSTAPAAASVPAPLPLEAHIGVTGIPWLQPLVYALVAAVAAGVLAWGIGEKTHDYYRISDKAMLSSRDFAALNREKAIVDKKNTAIVFGTLGALLGLFSGVSGGAARRSIPDGARAALAGLVLGGTGGALMGYQLSPIFARFYSDESPSLLLPFLVRGGIWAVAGTAAGMALGWGWHGLSGIPRALTGGLIGSVCGTVAFEVANAVLFPADRNDAVIPSSTQARLLACLFVSAGVALGAVVIGRHGSFSESHTPSTHS